ncbi:2-amino-4-hydroxy-6-hydroxymethyldihydropteridine diphosphokinase [Occallatibacter riparius]|uniref:2-amino-4-hydroxy-6-hydroxymethyldihydropteridine pyrophosphokinase n=1 Tax=Occallatibacter riparius TaxID=1002689 RepID=A0A9J7BU43_9BACT|nr:2-amino-4-hydroxy-6-hydroxymethyldihydropteridine diphosphokinase [Occallatibacter riparius]UWZ86105.1 2-amino-4-hydroxy-6-hydroxymethyldihydropteridine diphosphokinase [Occallatibacter riparius]
MQIAYIGMGGNIPSTAGPAEATLVAAVQRLGSLGRIVAASSLYSTEPVGYADQPRFVNAVVAIETGLSARQVLESLLCIERAFGRDRSAGIKDGPRTLDLDLLLLGDEVVHESGLELPHPRIAERAFVLAPLAEIAPDLVIVTQGKSVKELLQRLTSDKTRNAVLPLHSDQWRAGGSGDIGARADARHADD